MIFIMSDNFFLAYPKIMKPTVPETGTVLRLEGEKAVIRMKGGKSCKGCGMAAIGLCRAGDTNMLLTAINAVDARAGDTVLVSLDRQTKLKGYFLAYMSPVFALLSGALAGRILGEQLSMPHLDALGGFLILVLASFFSFKKLKHLDNTHNMVIKKVIGDNVFTGEIKSEEERWYPKYTGFTEH
jgi:sigma-E factor negative regulatory protein RseC